ncbi:transmembrane protein 26-like [Tubulanus polymorphus]|uniref:transmembrane protein 26-like n=1 Tax=Tubulanus polymorphus TaxID=672921 RepID=UPI003DA364CF
MVERRKNCSTDFANIIRAVTVRAVLASAALVSIWRVTDIYQSGWLFTLLLLPLAIEGVIRVVKYKGVESKWFCYCFLFFLIPNVTCIWILQIHYDHSSAKKENKNIQTAIREVSDKLDLELPFEFTTEKWIITIEQFMLIILTIARLVLPNKSLSHRQLSDLLLVYLGSGADIVEFYETLMELDARKHRYHLTYTLLGVWTWSLMLFTLVLTANKNRNAKKYPILADERWSIIASCVFIDGRSSAFETT